MPIKGLDSRIDIWFAADCKTFFVRMPYHPTTWEMLSCFSMYRVWRRWDNDLKAREFKVEDYDGILELLHQYFGDKEAQLITEEVF